ncbi:MAG: glycosyltransferase [Burkholderiaceae bacterium]|nr:glycosyltransferase [Burkholderiaceae bacterium]
MSAETIAVITTVLNERDSICVLLDAFLAQTRQPDEIVVVDGGSTDGTVDLLKTYAQAHPILKLHVEPGVNIARGRNIAIHRSNCSIVAVTDGGCRPEPNWLEELVNPLLVNSDYDAVTGERRIIGANRFEEFAGLLSTSVNPATESERMFHGRNSAFRKMVWTRVGGYPEWLYTAEDTLFSLRAKALGCRVALAEKAVVSWRPRPNLRKLCKQYYLYGRGTGRIGSADIRTITYHLRNHALWILPLLLTPVYPWFFLVAAGILAFIFFTLVKPVLVSVRLRTKTSGSSLYVPIIVMIRSLANNVGQLLGDRDYRLTEPFRVNLNLYLSGKWQMSPDKFDL